MLILVDNILRTIYGWGINQHNTQITDYVYLDDALFSGNTVLYDVRDWAAQAKQNTKLHLVFLATHSSGLDYLEKPRNLTDLTQSHHLSLHYWRLHHFENLSRDRQYFECLWPHPLSGEDLVDTYVQKLMARSRAKDWSPRLFRPPEVPTHETLFSSPGSRDIVEQAFLRAGSYIVSLSANAKPEMRPLGYEKLESLGFGSVFVTYRNIANNCPLALWWGDPRASSNHPFSKWYPLFPRKTNENLTSRMTGYQS